MTNKLEISRELAEKCLDGAASMGWSIAEELRALLAAPVVDENAHLPHKVESLSDFLSRGTPEPSNKCGRCGASTVEGCNYLGCHFLESGNGAPVVGRQEPVAEVIRLSVGATAVILKGYEGMREGTKLYTEQPAPVAAPHTMKSVMKAVCAAHNFPMLTSNQCQSLADALNEGLDKVKELNQ